MRKIAQATCWHGVLGGAAISLQRPTDDGGFAVGLNEPAKAVKQIPAELFSQIRSDGEVRPG